MESLTHRKTFSSIQLTDRQQRIYNFLSTNPVGVLSTVTPNGNPHGVVVYFGIDTEFSVSILTKKETRKYDNLIHNNYAMLTVFEPMTQTTVQVTGVAKEITDLAEINGVAGATLSAGLKTSELGLPPISKLQAGDYAAFKIRPVQIRMAVFGKANPGTYEELFDKEENYEVDIG